MPVADPKKVRRRQHEYPEDDMNKSYVFDAAEDQRARKEDSKKIKSLRRKQRDLEEQLNRSKRSNPNNTLQTIDMGASDDSLGIDDLENSTASLSDMGGGGAPTRKRKKKKGTKKTKSTSLPSKAKRLSEHLEGGALPSGRNRGCSISVDGASRNSGSLGGTKRKVKMRDTDRLLRSRSQGNGMLRQDPWGGGASWSGDNGSMMKRPGMNGQRHNSAHLPPRSGPHGGSLIRPSSPRGRSPLPRGNSSRPRSLSRQPSVGSVRSHSMDRSLHPRTLSRQPSVGSVRSYHMDRSGHQSLPDMGYRAQSTHDHPQQSPRRRTRAKSMDRSQSYGGRTFVRQNSMQLSAGGAPSMTRSRSMQRPTVSSSKRPNLAKVRSAGDIGSRSTTVIKQGNKSVLLVPMTKQEAEELRKDPSKFKQSHQYGKYILGGRVEVEETPPRSLVLIWAVVMAELGFDLGTTIIAFMALLEEDDCCGETMSLGPIPMSVTSPFFLLVFAELAFLTRAVILTLWPSMLTKRNNEEADPELEEANAKRSCFMRYFCCCLRWNAHVILKILNFLVLLNPFFGCVIAWILLYQSNKTEAFWVLGLEGGSIILHFISVYLEGGLDSWCSILFHCIPLVPFIVSVTMVLIYLNYGGVCYIVDRNNFSYWGCEVCDDDWPPVDGMCRVNGTNLTIPVSNSLFDVDLTSRNASALRDDLFATTAQQTYCAHDHPDGPQIDFCWFKYLED